MQFSLQNVGRLVIPAVGGVVIDALGDEVVLGFHLVLCAAGASACIASAIAYKIAMQQRDKDSIPRLEFSADAIF